MNFKTAVVWLFYLFQSYTCTSEEALMRSRNFRNVFGFGVLLAIIFVFVCRKDYIQKSCPPMKISKKEKLFFFSFFFFFFFLINTYCTVCLLGDWRNSWVSWGEWLQFGGCKSVKIILPPFWEIILGYPLNTVLSTSFRNFALHTEI